MLAVDLRNRVALVTGAAGGLGFAIASALVTCGARVAINDVDAAAASRAANTLGAECMSMPGDIAQEGECEAIVRGSVAGFGRLDILVNNAGVDAPLPPTGAQELHDWQRVMDVNLRGTYLMSRAANRHFVAAGGGAIVNIGSIAGVASMPASNDYAVSKAAVAMMTQTMAADVSRKRVRVNCVAPGFCDSGLLHRVASSNPALRDAYLERIPMRRFGLPDEIARVVAFLCSDLAAYITGAVVPVDGGWLANAGP